MSNTSSDKNSNYDSFLNKSDPDHYLKDGFEIPEKRTNVTWFYPKICGFQDKLNSIEERNEYFSYLDRNTHPRKTKILLYLHIPFCEAFCNFCACFKESSIKWQGDKREQFVNAMIKEIERIGKTNYFHGSKIAYVQFGGGTPSSLDKSSMQRIIEAVFKNFDLSEVEGISFEGSPLGLSEYGYIEMLRDVGITRLSFGVQTLNEDIRRQMTIKASVQQVYDTAENIHKSGIKTFALDLMYNLPNQSLEILDKDIKGICEDLRPTFVQTYRFNQWEGTRLDNSIRSAKDLIQSPTGLNEWEQYKYIVSSLAGYGYKNRHLINFFGNLDDPGPIGLGHACGGNRYRGSYTIGIGPGAESYLGERSWRNHTDVDKWVSDVESGYIPVEQARTINENDVEDRQLVFFPAFGVIKKADIANIGKYRNNLNWLKSKNYIEEMDDAIVLTELGREMAGNIAYLFYSEEEKERARRTMYLSMKHNKNPFHQDDVSMPKQSIRRSATNAKVEVQNAG